MECSYIVWQLEKGSTRHIQGFVQWKDRKKFSTVKRRLPEGCHIEKMRGTSKQASEYCKKKETALKGPWERGTLIERGGGQGSRNDLLQVKRQLDDGVHLWDIAKGDDDFGTVIKHSRSLAQYENVITEGRKNKTICIVHYGTAGTGKTTIARLHKQVCSISRGNSGLWYDGYRPGKHTTLLFDEFGGHTMAINEFKRLVDRAPLNVDTKGGSVNMIADTVVLTSNEEPSQWWTKNIGIHWPAINRRLDHVFRYYWDKDNCDCGRKETRIERLRGSWKANGIIAKFPDLDDEKTEAIGLCIPCIYELKEEELIKENWF